MLRLGLLLAAVGAAGCVATPIPLPLQPDLLSPTSILDGSRSIETKSPPPPNGDRSGRLDAGQSGFRDGEGGRDGLSDALFDGRRDGMTGDGKLGDGLKIGDKGAPPLDGASDSKKKDGAGDSKKKDGP